MPIGRTPFLSLVAALLAAPGTPAAGQDAAPVVRTPPVEARRSVSVQLAQQVGNLLDLIARPDPRYATFASLAPGVRLWVIGQGRDRMVEGAAVQEALNTILRQPDDDHTLTVGTPDVRIDGRFGRFAVVVAGRERGRSVGGCLALHGDAILSGQAWSFVHLTLTRRQQGCEQP